MAKTARRAFCLWWTQCIIEHMFEQIGEMIVLIVLVVLALVVGFVAGRSTAPKVADPAARAELEEARAQVAAGAEAKAQLDNQLAYMRNLVASLQQQENDRIAAERAKDDQRHQLALRTQGAQKDGEAKLLEAFAPVQRNLATLEQKVAQMEESRKQEMGALDKSLQVLEQRQTSLGKQTESLASALSNNKVRGAWGEAQLKNIVESAGLLQHVDFDVQVQLQDGDARKRPDMVVYLPGGKSIPIDAKTPYNDYQRACAIPDSADPAQLAEKKRLLENHAKAVRSHIDELDRRAYFASMPQAPDFVIAFIPSESVLQAAFEADPHLMDYAFSKHVALCSPTTLWAVLKSVAYAWQQQGVTENARQLLNESKKLYGRIATLGANATKLGNSITRTVKNYNVMVGSLEGSVLSAARKFKDIDPDVVVPEVEALDSENVNVRELVAPEFARSGEPDGNGGGQGDDATAIAAGTGTDVAAAGAATDAAAAGGDARIPSPPQPASGWAGAGPAVG